MRLANNPKYFQTNSFGFGVGVEKFIVFRSLRIEKTNESGAQNTFAYDFVEPIDRLLRFDEQFADFFQNKKENDGNDRQYGKNQKSELPIGKKKQDGYGHYQKRRRDDGRYRGRYKSFDGIDVGREIGQKSRGA